MACATLFEPIAIIGISCEFAGDIHMPIDLWQALEESRDLGSEIPVERTDLLSYCADTLNRDNGEFKRKLIRRGYFLPTSVLDTFDAGYFNLSDGEAVTIDPCHRLLMMKFVHLIEDAGYTLEKIRGSRTSVHIGQFSNDHALGSLRLKPEHRTRFLGPHILLYNASARLSYHFDLHGPNVSLDTACSSGLQAVHLGVQALRTGEADMAVCGGVNAIFTPEHLLNFSTVGAVAVDGRSQSFSIDANGYAKGEGLGLILLKRLSDAERDGDRIYCILHDVLSNHDGSEGKSGYVVPAAVGQARLLGEIYARTQYDRNRIFYVEAHGTGTQVGDSTEANTIGKFFQRSPFDPPVLIGSVKSNIGHTEGAAGIASLIKTVMCMKHRAIPPNMHFKAYNSKIEADRFNLHVVQTMTVFPPINIDGEKEHTVAIGISSFGIGGNNAHAIIEEYHPKERLINTNGHFERELLQQHSLFIFSTKSSNSLHKQVISFNEWLKQIEPQDDESSFLARISQQLLLKRTISHEHLAIFVSANRAQLQQQLDLFVQKQSTPGLLVTKRVSSSCHRICFVFSGQGPQWWAMGRELYSSEPIFRQWIQRISEELLKINGGEFNLLSEMIEKTERESRVNDTNIAQPAIFSVQVALAALLISWHIFPSAIVSHSAGEQAAAFISGRVSLNEAVRIVYNRSRLQHRNTRQGGRMLAVAMNEQEVRDSLLKGIEHLVCVAGVNSPRSVTLSGDEKIIDELEGILATFHPTVFKARLRIENAFHSHQMDRFGIREEIFSTLDDIRGLLLENTQEMFDVRCAQVPLYSPVTGDRIDDKTPLDAHHWWSNIRQCVRFGDTIQAIIQDGVIDAFLELSPHPVLATSIHECCEKTSTFQPLILPTLKRKEDDQKTLLTSIAQLSYSPDVWKHFLASRCVQPSKDVEHLFDSFPLYAFNLTPCWYESKESAIERLAYRLPSHPLLGVRQWAQHTSAIWKSLINLNLPEYAYLSQHKMQDAILLPAAGFLEMALAACRQLLPVANNDETPPPIAFEQVEFIKALVLNEHELTEVIIQIVMPMREWLIYSRPWSAAGPDCQRSSGMACNDFIDSFVDLQTLNAYSLRQFTLHARGRIDIGPHLNIHASSAYSLSKEETAKWTVDLLPSSNILMNETERQEIEMMNSENDNINNQLADSIEPLNALAGMYALQALQHLASLENIQLIVKDKLRHLVRDDEFHFLRLFEAAFSLVHQHGLIDECGKTTMTVTNHSIQLIRKTLVNRFPRLKSFVTLMDAVGSKLGQVLFGEQSHEQLLIQNKETELALEDVQNTIAFLKTQCVFQALINHMHNNHPNSLRILLFGVDESHDIIFVASVLQTTNDINHSLNSLRRLLVPGGLLLVVELTLTHSYFDLIFGLFPYWWRNDHNRAPLNIDQWRQAFQSVGGFEPMVVSAKANAFGDSLMIVRKSTARSILIHLSEWQDQAWLLFADRTHNLSHALVPHLPSSNIEILPDSVIIDHISSTIDIMLKQYKQLHIVFAWPLDVLQLGQNNNETTFVSHVEHLCYKFIYILQSIQKYHRQNNSFPYVFILTQNSQPMHEKSEFNPVIASLIGLARSLSIECPRHHIKLIDLQPTADIFVESFYCDILIEHMINSREADNLDEVVLSREADRRIQCFQWHYDWLQSKEQQELSSKMERTIVPKNDADKNPFWLQVAPSRFVADLAWVRGPILIRNLSSGQIQVRIHCTSLNFRDVLKIRGLYPHTRVFGQRDYDEPLFDRDTTPGTDVMGTVILSHSKDLKIGDRVIALWPPGTFHSHIILDASAVSRVPDECLLSDEQLAALPTAFLTALLSLKHRIRLKHGQTVLIHAATGATGQACIQYCQAVGARVIATAVRERGTILVSGGLGGLGLTMSRWMVEKRGVKHIVLMSRRTIEQFEKVENNPQLEDWLQLKETATKYNASINVIQADVTHFDDVYELIKRLNQTSHPVRGIIHSAVISDDKLLTNLSQETLFRVMEPKVRGGWNLHQASQQTGASLHFFVMFSSIRNHLIDPGSSSYNAGNEFFEALAHYRREQLKLPALSIALPAVQGAGMFHRQQVILNNLLIAQGMEMLPT
ncbi:unnamed protein product, partial [Rotaria sordida]